MDLLFFGQFDFLHKYIFDLDLVLLYVSLDFYLNHKFVSKDILSYQKISVAILHISTVEFCLI